MPRPLHILHLTGASDAGGLSRYLLDLCGGLIARGCRVSLAGQRGAWHDRFLAAGLEWIELPLRGGPLSLRRSAAELSARLSRQPVDILHTHYRKPTLVARRVTRLLAPQAGPPILYTVHQPRIRLAGPWRWLSDFGDHTHAPSQDARRWLLETANVPDRRLTVIPHGVDPARFPLRDEGMITAARAALNLRADQTVAAFVGRLDVPKNAAWMLDVAQACKPTIANLKILIAGDGPEMDQMRQAIHAKNLGAIVTLLGERPVLGVYQAADALFSPSQREGFSLACAEAMCVGLPVLRTRTGGAEEMILPGITGAVTDIDPQSFARAAAEFLRDRAALSKMGAAAAAHIRANFTLDLQVERTIDLYRRLIDDRLILERNPR